jgi:hypothetical protein
MMLSFGYLGAMRYLLCTVLVVLTFAPAARAYGPQGRSVGIGVMLPEPTGFTLEAYLSRNTALDFAIGWNTFDERHGYGHVDYLVLPFDLSRGGSLSVPFYLGIGAFLFDAGDAFFGARVPFGLALNLRRAPLQFFGEVALRVLLIAPGDPPRRIDVDGAVGFRIFF